MSCGSCRCSPCECEHECDPSQESVASQLDNFIAAFFGSITKTCVNNEVVWSLPCDLDAGIEGFPRLPGEGIACYLLRVLGPQPPPPSGFARGFPSARAVWLDLDAALQTPSGQPAFTTAQAAYNAADAMATLLGEEVVIAVGKGHGTDFGSILTDGLDWNPLVTIFGLGRNISSIDVINTISTTVANSASGDVNLKINGCSIDTAIATFTMDTSGTFDAGDVTLDGDDSVITTIYTAAPAGGGDGGDVSIVDGSGIIFGSIITSASAGGSTSGSVIIGQGVQGAYIGTSVSGSAGDAGNVTLGNDAKLFGSIDALSDIGAGGDVLVGQNAIVGVAITTTSSDGQAGDVTTGVGSIVATVVANSSNSNGATLSISGYATSVTAECLAGSFTAATVIINQTGHVGSISAQSTGTGGTINVVTSGVVDSIIVNSSSGGASGAISIASGAHVGEIVSNSTGANGPSINMYGTCNGNISGSTTGAFTAATISIGDGFDSSSAWNITAQSPGGTGGSVLINESSSAANIDVSGSTGGSVVIKYGSQALAIVANGSAGNGGSVDIWDEAFSISISAQSVGLSGVGGTVNVLRSGTVSGEINTTSSTSTAGAVSVGEEAFVGSIVAFTASGAGPTINMFGFCHGSIVAEANVAGGTGGNINIGSTIQGAHAGDVSSQSTGGTGGNINVRRLSDVGNINTTGDTGGSVNLDPSSKALIIDSSGAAGNGGNVALGPDSVCQSIDTTSIGGDGGAVVLGLNSVVTEGVVTVSDAAASGSVNMLHGAKVELEIDVSATTGTAGTFFAESSNSGFSVDGTATTGQASTVTIGAGCRFDQIDISHVGGTNGILQATNASFIDLFINADTSGGGTVVNLFNCVTSGVVDGSAINGARVANITIRSGSHASITIAGTNALSNVVNISAAFTGDVDASNSGGPAPSTVVINASDVGNVNASGTGGSAGGIIDCDSSKILNVDISGAISGVLRGRNCRLGDVVTSQDGNMVLENCVLYGQVSNAGFLSRFLNCNFESVVANSDCVADLFSDGALFSNCNMRPNGTGFPVQSSAPHTIYCYNVLTRNAFAPNVGFIVANFIVEPAL